MQPTKPLTGDIEYYLFSNPDILTKSAFCAITDVDYDICCQVGKEILNPTSSLNSLKPILETDHAMQFFKKICRFANRVTSQMVDSQADSTPNAVIERAVSTSVAIVQYFSHKEITISYTKCLTKLFKNVFESLQNEIEPDNDCLEIHLYALQKELNNQQTERVDLKLR